MTTLTINEQAAQLVEQTKTLRKKFNEHFEGYNAVFKSMTETIDKLRPIARKEDCDPQTRFNLAQLLRQRFELYYQVPVTDKDGNLTEPVNPEYVPGRNDEIETMTLFGQAHFNSDNPEASYRYARMALTYHQNGQNILEEWEVEAAAQALKKAADSDPENYEYQLSTKYHFTWDFERYEEVEPYLRQTIALAEQNKGPKDYENDQYFKITKRGLVMSLAHQDKLDEALQIAKDMNYEEFATKDYHALGMAVVRNKGEPNLAVSYLEAIQKETPKAPGTFDFEVDYLSELSTYLLSKPSYFKRMHTNLRATQELIDIGEEIVKSRSVIDPNIKQKLLKTLEEYEEVLPYYNPSSVPPAPENF